MGLGSTAIESEHWIEIVSSECEFDIQNFEGCMQLLIAEPNIVSPAILRAEIITEYHNSLILRKIIPRQKDKDGIVVQRIEFNYKEDTLEIEHSAVSTNNSAIQNDEILQLPLYSVDLLPYSAATTNESTITKDEILQLPLSSVDLLPYFYPKFQRFKYIYKQNRISISVLPYPNTNLHTDPRMITIWTRILKFIFKISTGIKNGYQKKVHHDICVDKISYQNLYEQLKSKYRYWVDLWCEETDPAKHVFEDVSIATWLILIWKQQPDTDRHYKFIDLGCGNGFLTYILTQEGYKGYGVDLTKRKLWDKFPENTVVTERALNPDSEIFENVEWIIGNHPDELTLWIPIISAKSGVDSKFMIIPCCFHELSGSRSIKSDPKLGRYLTYCQMIDDEAKLLGFKMERESLRIPSTKNVCVFSRSRTDIVTQEEIECLYKGVQVVLRKSDREKTFEYLARKAKREEQ
jgi:hypothetical protein